jgi:transcription antitermination factor NusG
MMTIFVERSLQGVLVLVGVAGICWSISILPYFRNGKGLLGLLRRSSRAASLFRSDELGQKRFTIVSKEIDSPGPVAAFSSLVSGERWYVVQTLPCCEAKARMQLEAQGFLTFLPRHAKTIRHARRLTTVSAPFFPRYLFVALDLGRDRWRCVNGTFGVAGLLTANDRPMAVPVGVVEGLTAQCDADGNLRLGETLAIGQRVRILDGPFAELIGQLARVDGGGRVQVLLRLLGGDVRVAIDRRALMPAAAITQRAV